MAEQIFTKTSRIEALPQTVFQWHVRPGALERLTPPWESVTMLEKTGQGIETGARVRFRIKTGPFNSDWIAEHTEFIENEMFRDRQAKGPFAQWEHTHRFHPAGETACLLEDTIRYRLPMAPFGPLAAGRFVKRKLERMFTYRHAITRLDIADHQAAAPFGPMNVLISGASGLVGSALIPFLTTGGHRVTRLVRRKTEGAADEVFWDPAAGRLDTGNLSGIDTIIHLSGENIGEGRWTPEKKREILESRIRGTSLIAETAAKLTPRPKVLVCASAIGYYGNRGECLLSETDQAGGDFISMVCSEWEKAAQPAAAKGIRVVFARIGIALTPAGGALKKLLPPFQLGFGGKIASGEQYMSWISMDDVVGAIHFLATRPEVEGPVNLVAPEPVTNREFTRILAETFRRPAPFTVPSFAIHLMFGEMGKEIPLSSTRVTPSVLLERGYRFRHPELTGALAHLLGT
ncbi:MAG: TIGR01777 family oxidoreductase [Thermodesulfobacteriota bacterium]